MAKATKKTQGGRDDAKKAEARASVAWSARRWKTLVAVGVAAILGANVLLGSLGGAWLRVTSFLGLAFLLGLALLMSADLRRLPVRAILVGLGLQVALGLLVLRTPVGWPVFGAMAKVFEKIVEATRAGAIFVFGDLAGDVPKFGFVLAFQVLTIIVFIGALSRMLYHWGILQQVVKGLAWLMRRVMRASGAESLAAGANVFVGMVEAPLMVRPYVAGMTRSELFTVMTAGMATVAGSVMAAYVGMLRGSFLGESAGGHLLTASLMSAPAAILIAKIMIPETETPATLDIDLVPNIDEGDETPVNVMDAAARGAGEGLKLALSVGGMLVAFVGLVAMANIILGAVSGGHLTFQRLAGWAFSPVALGMGLPLDDALRAGTLMGEKTVLNEFIAYEHLAREMTADAGWVSSHASLVMSYALCGFANFGSVAIMIAGIGGIAPNQRPNLARLGLLSIVSGSLAAFMTGCMVGFLY